MAKANTIYRVVEDYSSSSGSKIHRNVEEFFVKAKDILGFLKANYSNAVSVQVKETEGIGKYIDIEMFHEDNCNYYTACVREVMRG